MTAQEIVNNYLAMSTVDNFSVCIEKAYQAIIGRRRYNSLLDRTIPIINFHTIKAWIELSIAVEREIEKFNGNITKPHKGWFELLFFIEFPELRRLYYYWLSIDNEIKEQTFYHPIRRKLKLKK